MVSQDASTGEVDWSVAVPLLVKAMVLTGDNVIAGGVPDAVDPDEPWAAFEGRGGAEIAIHAKSDGSPVGTYELPAAAVHDGMAAAHGRLFISLEDGKLVCLEGE